MTLEFVEKLPKRKRPRHRLQDFIEKFVNDDHKIAKVNLDEHDYKSLKVCYSCLRVAVQRSGRLVKVMMRGSDVYLVKTI